MIRNLTLLVLLCCSIVVKAQYTNVINSNKPGFSESPYSVGTGIYQFETSLFLRDLSIEPTFSRPQSFGLNTFFRTSFFDEKLEFNLDFSIQRNKIAFENIFNSHYFNSGIGSLRLGAKYLVYEQKYDDKSKEIRSWKKRHAFDWKRAIPSVGVYVGFNFMGDLFDQGASTPKIGVLLQNDLTTDFNVVTNIFYDRIGSDVAEFSYIITGTYSFNPRWSGFIENQSIYSKLQSNTNIGGGFAFLYNPNLQINSSLRFMAEGPSVGYYISAGVSYRLNRHQDEEVFYDKDGNKITAKEKNKSLKPKKKGFFGRIFGPVGDVFKKKEKVEENPNVRKRPRRVRKQGTTRKATKAKKKGFFGRMFGKKEKKETEKEKLEREIKELEKQLAKDEKKAKKEEKKRKKKEEKEAKKKKKKKKDNN